MKPDRTQILSKLQEILDSADDSLSAKVGTINEDMSLLKDLGLSSVGLLLMSVLIEDSFNVSLENVNVWELNTIGDVIDTITELQK